MLAVVIDGTGQVTVMLFDTGEGAVQTEPREAVTVKLYVPGVVGVPVAVAV